MKDKEYIEEMESALIDLIYNIEVNDILFFKLDMSNVRACEIHRLVHKTVVPAYAIKHNITGMDP